MAGFLVVSACEQQNQFPSSIFLPLTPSCSWSHYLSFAPQPYPRQLRSFQTVWFHYYSTFFALASSLSISQFSFLLLYNSPTQVPHSPSPVIALQFSWFHPSRLPSFPNYLVSPPPNKVSSGTCLDHTSYCLQLFLSFSKQITINSYAPNAAT